MAIEPDPIVAGGLILQKALRGQAKFRNPNLPDVENFPDFQSFSVSEENFYIGCQKKSPLSFGAQRKTSNPFARGQNKVKQGRIWRFLDQFFEF